MSTNPSRTQRPIARSPGGTVAVYHGDRHTHAPRNRSNASFATTVTDDDTAELPVLRLLIEQNMVFRKAIRLALMSRVDEWFATTLASTVIAAYLTGVAQNLHHWHHGHSLSPDEQQELLVALTGFGSQVAALSHSGKCDTVVYTLRLLIHENEQNIASVLAKTTHVPGLGVASDVAIPEVVPASSTTSLASGVHFNSKRVRQFFVEICEHAEVEIFNDEDIFDAVKRATEISTEFTKSSLDAQAIADHIGYERAVCAARLAGKDGVAAELHIAASRTIVAADAPMPSADVFKLLGAVRGRAMTKGRECRLV